MAANDLRALTRSQLGGLDELVAAQAGTIDIRVVEPLHVVSIRMLPGGADAVARAAAAIGLDALPGAGGFTGTTARLLWRNPTELLLFTPDRGIADAALHALAAAPDALAVAVDQSDGLVTLALHGAALDAVLHRLVDAAVPLAPGQGTRARLADIAVIAMRLDAERAWLVADRANDRYLTQWVAYAADAVSCTS